MALGQILSQTMVTSGTQVQRSPASLSNNINRLLSAIVVSPRFRQLLFSDPAAALAAGYNGEKFQLTPTEYDAVTSLHVNTVREFAAQLLRTLQQVTTDSIFSPAEAEPEYPRRGIRVFNAEFNRS